MCGVESGLEWSLVFAWLAFGEASAGVVYDGDGDGWLPSEVDVGAVGESLFACGGEREDAEEVVECGVRGRPRGDELAGVELGDGGEPGAEGLCAFRACFSEACDGGAPAVGDGVGEAGGGWWDALGGAVEGVADGGAEWFLGAFLEEGEAPPTGRSGEVRCEALDEALPRHP